MKMRFLHPKKQTTGFQNDLVMSANLMHLTLIDMDLHHVKVRTK